jgi:hypothetical protein
MRKFFQYINRQPKAVRDNYALGIAITFTALVLMVWVVARPGGEALVVEVISADEASSPFSTLLKETKEKFSNVRDSFAESEQDGETNNTQSATLINNNPTNPEEMVLTEEDIEIARQNYEKSSSSENYLLDKSNLVEVMIATSSASTTTLPACSDIVINSASSGVGVSCLSSVKAATTTTR